MSANTLTPESTLGGSMMAQLTNIQQHKHFISHLARVSYDIHRISVNADGQEVYGFTDDTPLSVYREEVSRADTEMYRSISRLQVLNDNLRANYLDRFVEVTLLPECLETFNITDLVGNRITRVNGNLSYFVNEHYHGQTELHIATEHRFRGVNHFRVRPFYDSLGKEPYSTIPAVSVKFL